MHVLLCYSFKFLFTTAAATGCPMSIANYFGQEELRTERRMKQVVNISIHIYFIMKLMKTPDR
jgi:hypothetical protein